jgi:hypothetical protein
MTYFLISQTGRDNWKVLPTLSFDLTPGMGFVTGPVTSSLYQCREHLVPSRPWCFSRSSQSCGLRGSLDCGALSFLKTFGAHQSPDRHVTRVPYVGVKVATQWNPHHDAKAKNLPLSISFAFLRINVMLLSSVWQLSTTYHVCQLKFSWWWLGRLFSSGMWRRVAL